MDWTKRLSRGESWRLRRTYIINQHRRDKWADCDGVKNLLDLPAYSEFVLPLPEKPACIVDRPTWCVTPSEYPCPVELDMLSGWEVFVSGHLGR